MRWEVGAGEMGSLSRIMKSELSCNERSPCRTFLTRWESIISRMLCRGRWMPREGELSTFVYSLADRF